MIYNILGIDTVGGGGGGAGHYGVCHIMRYAVMILFLIFIKDRSSLQYFITPRMDGSEFYVPYPSHYM